MRKSSPDVKALDYGFAVSILQNAQNGLRKQIYLLLAWRCHFTVYQPVGRTKGKEVNAFATDWGSSPRSSARAFTTALASGT